MEIALPRPFHNRTARISNTKFGKPLDECVLKRGQVRDHGNDGVAQGLGKLVRSSHDFGQAVCCLNHMLDHWQAFGTIAVEQLLIAMTVQEEVELPDQIPGVV